MTTQALFNLTGRTALVTGASSGLGAHFAEVLASAGATIILAARRAEALAAVCERITATGGTARTLILDVSDAKAIEGAKAAFETVDILVNNAGIAIDGPALEQSEADWDAVIDTNLKAAFLMAQAVARAMKARQGGSIINIASILGLRQAGAVVSYAVSKAGMIQLTKTLALEWARYGIRVNALAPGYIETDLNSGLWETDIGKALIRRIPFRRLGRIEELDGPLLLLASDASSYMSGSVIAADGGHLVNTL